MVLVWPCLTPCVCVQGNYKKGSECVWLHTNCVVPVPLIGDEHHNCHLLALHIINACHTLYSLTSKFASVIRNSRVSAVEGVSVIRQVFTIEGYPFSVSCTVHHVCVTKTNIPA